MTNIFRYFQLIIGILLVTAILIQPKGMGLGNTTMVGSSYRSKRGLDRFISKATILLTALFLLVSILRMFMAK